MNLISDLESDLAQAFIVEKKHTEKICPREAKALIAEVRKSLQPILSKNKTGKEKLCAKKCVGTFLH